ncbi:P-loop NTPase [bacterium]|nr:P-loop NTPase [bacterium]
MFGSNKLSEKSVQKALSTVMDPDLNQDIVSLGMISAIKIDGSKVSFKLTLTTPACPLKEKIEGDARQAVMSIEGVESVAIETDATVPGQKRNSDKLQVEGVKHIIAVTSGKGGVGKTTVSINLAIALKNLGARVGILDSDITGPNCPLMLGVDDYEPQAKENRIIPAENYGIKCMSMAFFVAKDTPLIWRGPMLDKAIKQFLTDVDWGELDYLIVDMPPGTGDAQLTMIQATDVSGGVIVTTPQEVALLDGRKGLAMFKQMNVPVLGFVENMSYFQPPGSEERFDIFGTGGGRKLAEEYDVPFLGEIPLDTKVREGGDTGKPVVASDPDSAVARAFTEVAKQVAANISIQTLAPVS